MSNGLAMIAQTDRQTHGTDFILSTADIVGGGITRGTDWMKY